MGNTWQGEEAWIFIERLWCFCNWRHRAIARSSSDGCKVFVIGGIVGSTDLRQTAAIVRDLGDTRGDITIGESPLDGRCRMSLIVRSRSLKLPDLDRTADGGRVRTTIVVRSWPDRGAIVYPLRRNQGHDPSHCFGRRSFEHQHHDRRLIAARSWLDRGSNWSGINANSAGDWSHDVAQ